MGLQYLFGAGPAVCPLFVPGPEEQMTPVCIEVTSAAAEVHLDCTSLLPPLTKIHLDMRQVSPALGLAVIIDAIFLF